MRRPAASALALSFALVVCFDPAGVAGQPDPAEPPPSPDAPAPVPSPDEAAAAEAGAAHADDDGEDLGWEPDQRGFEGTGEQGGNAPEPDSPVSLSAMESEGASSSAMLYLDGSIGAQYVDLGALGDRDLLPQGASRDAAGVAFSIAGGVHLSQFYAGARGILALNAPFDLAAMELEGGLRAPLPFLGGDSTLAVRFGVGWAWLNQSDYADAHMLTELPVGGPIFEVGAMLDTWLSEDVTLGVAADGMLLLPSRAPSTCDEPSPDGECVVDGFDFARGGNGVGLGTRLRLVLGVHF